MSVASTPRRADRRHIVAVANQKGGVGKTTTAINLGAALAVAGYATTIIDLDPQGNASTGLGSNRRSRVEGTYTLLQDPTSLARVRRSTSISGLTLVAADPDLAGAEIELVQLDRREYRLREALWADLLAEDDPGFVLIDCPPSLGLLTVNGLVAADTVLVPLQCEFFALEGVGHIVQTVERIKRGLNRSLRLEGIVLTMFDRRNNLSDLVAADARSFFGRDVFDTVIPRNIRVSEAPSHGVPVLTYDPKSAGAIAYQQLASELVDRRNRTS